ncbi:class I SAM-dependent methyltransferase, partial [Nanoarchaeota archaeon]
IPKPNYNFICGDATKLNDLVEDDFDVIVANHPEVLGDNEVWNEIFSEAFKKQESGGTLICTFYMKDEMEMMERILIWTEIKFLDFMILKLMKKINILMILIKNHLHINLF